MADTDDDDDDELAALINTLLAEMRDLNIRFGALRVVIQEQLGVTDAQYDEALERARLAGHVPPDGGTIKH